MRKETPIGASNPTTGHKHWENHDLKGRRHPKVYLPSVQFSRSVVSNSLQPYGLQYARPPCPPSPSSTPGIYSNSCPLSQWCYLTTSSSVIPFSSCLQSFPVSGSFPMSQLFASGGRSIGASTLVSVLPMTIQENKIDFYILIFYPILLNMFISSNGISGFSEYRIMSPE